MSVVFFGGPLDGCVEDDPGEMVRQFPNPTDPENSVIVYVLVAFPALRYHYDPILTEKANLLLRKKRGLSSP